MEIKTKVYFKDYVKVGDEYKHIEVGKPFFCHSFDAFKNFIATLVDCSVEGSVLNLEIEKTLKEEE